MSNLKVRTFCLFVAAVVLQASELFAEESKPRLLTSATGRFFALPIELEADSGAANGDATVLRFAPLFGSPSAHDWKILHLTMITLADAPGGVPGQPGNRSVPVR